MEAKKEEVFVLTGGEAVNALVAIAQIVFKYHQPPPPPPADPEQVMVAEEGAKFIKVSLPTFRAWVKKGYIPPRVIAGEVRFLKSELLAALKRPEVQRTAARRKPSPQTPAAV